VDSYAQRVAAGEVEDWESYESSRYGYPTYQKQNYGYKEAIDFIQQSASHIRAVCAQQGITLS